MNRSSRKTLRGSVIIEMSVVFPLVVLVVLTLVVIVVFCFYQSNMRMENELGIFMMADEETVERYKLEDNLIKKSSHWDSLMLFRSRRTLFSTNSFYFSEGSTLIANKALLVSHGSYLTSRIYRMNELPRYEMMLIMNAMKQ